MASFVCFLLNISISKGKSTFLKRSWLPVSFKKICFYSCDQINDVDHSLSTYFLHNEGSDGKVVVHSFLSHCNSDIVIFLRFIQLFRPILSALRLHKRNHIRTFLLSVILLNVKHFTDSKVVLHAAAKLYKWIKLIVNEHLTCNMANVTYIALN